jgi:hypothetical protein
VLAYLIPGEVVISGFGTLTVVIGYLALTVSRHREKIAKLEEWARLAEKRWDEKETER